jgi:hypothetical protein
LDEIMRSVFEIQFSNGLLAAITEKLIGIVGQRRVAPTGRFR